jgi:hypothetical protein
MNSITTFLSIAFAVATLSLTAIAPAHAQGEECLTDGQIQTSIRDGEFQSWPKVKRLAGFGQDYEEVSGVEVCLQDGIPYYYVNVVSPDGEARKIVVNAIDGSL